MLNTLRQFDYLLKMIKDQQKKTLSEWIGLIRAALIEVDDGIGRGIIVLEDQEPVTFDQFREYMERIATDLQMAKRAFPLQNTPRSK